MMKLHRHICNGDPKLLAEMQKFKQKNVAAMARHSSREALHFSSKTHKPSAAPGTHGWLLCTTLELCVLSHKQEEAVPGVL